MILKKRYAFPLLLGDITWKWRLFLSFSRHNIWFRPQFDCWYKTERKSQYPLKCKVQSPSPNASPPPTPDICMLPRFLREKSIYITANSEQRILTIPPHIHSIILLIILPRLLQHLIDPPLLNRHLTHISAISLDPRPSALKFPTRSKKKKESLPSNTSYNP